MTNLSYPIPAPVFADAESQAEIIGHAATAGEAMAIYAEYYEGNDLPIAAAKATPERRGQGPVDGWVPKF